MFRDTMQKEILFNHIERKLKTKWDMNLHYRIPATQLTLYDILARGPVSEQIDRYKRVKIKKGWTLQVDALFPKLPFPWKL